MTASLGQHWVTGVESEDADLGLFWLSSVTIQEPYVCELLQCEAEVSFDNHHVKHDDDLVHRRSRNILNVRIRMCRGVKFCHCRCAPSRLHPSLAETQHCRQGKPTLPVQRISMSNKKEWVPGSSQLVKLPCTPLSLSQRDAAQPVVFEQSSVVFDRRRRRYHKHRAHIPDRMVLTG